jgi:hypothetical protein
MATGCCSGTLARSTLPLPDHNPHANPVIANSRKNLPQFITPPWIAVARRAVRLQVFGPGDG